MNRKPLQANPDDYPTCFHALLKGSSVFDSSCSPNASVLYIDTQGGLFLKSAPKGALAREAAITAYFSRNAIGPEVCAYESLDWDWLLTRAIPGEDCTHPMYLADPQRLCDSLATFLRMLHEQSPEGCPITNLTESYLVTAHRNHRDGRWDPALLSGDWRFSSEEEAWAAIEGYSPYLKSDTLIHGDYCLPNIMMDKWTFSGFIDVGSGGIGDRHVDLFWGIWSLAFNLKTQQFTDRFLDVYGREHVEPELLRAVAAIETFA